MSEAPPKHLWPLSLQRIAESCGEPVALDLWQHYPGVRVYIPDPESLSPEHPLVKRIGLDSAQMLSRHYPRETILVAKAHRARTMIRNFVIRKLNREGAKYAELGIRYDLSDRQILSICTADGLVPGVKKQESKQIDLFAEEAS
ncbi:hypothetical protein [Methylobacter sp.]|uniref:hypothetical protein n=1 Tax=Methylobacter sp. TaxID=2051955 RepID=UPI002FDE43D6